MSEPTTVHGRYVLLTSRLHTWAAFDETDVTQIEAEARAAALAELRGQVEGLPGAWCNFGTRSHEHLLHRDAVLALLPDPVTEETPG